MGAGSEDMGLLVKVFWLLSVGAVLRTSSVDGVAPRDSSAAKAVPIVISAALFALDFTAPARTRSCGSKGVASLMGSPISNIGVWCCKGLNSNQCELAQYHAATSK